jgi:succinate dehydrogenase / fumarate reductase flavoprotein subunit
VFLDISWITERLSNAEEHIKKKLPSMHHQFKQLADIDITKSPMEVGPTTHYIMGGILVDADSQMTTIPGLFAAGECAAGLHGANRLGGNSLSDLLVFGKLAGENAAAFAKQNKAGRIDESQIAEIQNRAVKCFDSHGPESENPYQIQSDLQEMMQNLVGIVRTAHELKQAVEELKKLRIKTDKVTVSGHREYNTGWHTALDLHNLLTVSEAITLSAIERKESRGAHFREDFPEKDEVSGKFNTVVRKSVDGGMQVEPRALAEMRPDLKQVIEEMK